MRTSAPGNVFLLGEHSVVYKRPALLASIGRRTYVGGRKRNDERIVIHSKAYGEINTTAKALENKTYDSYRDYEDAMDPLRDLVGHFSREIKAIEEGFEAEIESDIPKGSGGQSSSTAVLSAFLRFLSKIYGAKLRKQDYFTHLYPLQVKIHGGAASGSELASSVFGGYNHVVKTPHRERPVEFKNLGNLELDLVIGDTGLEVRTSQTVRRVREHWKVNRESYSKMFDAIGELVEDAEELISEGGDLEKLGNLMNKNQKILRELEVSHPKLDRLIEEARNAGAYGAKLSGGGGGGIMIALCDEENKQKVAEVIQQAGGKAAMTEVGVEGVRLEG